MSNHQDLLDAIEARLNTVTGIGVVHDRLRFDADWSKFMDHFKASVSGHTIIRAWQIRAIEINSEPSAFSANDRTYLFEIWGVNGVSDTENSEAAFVAITELVLDALDFQDDLGVSGVVKYSIGPATARFEDRMLGSVLVHSVTIRVEATVRKSGTYA